MVFGQLTVALRSGGTMSPLPVSAFRIEHIVTVQPDEGLRIGVEGIPQRFVIHYFNIINHLPEKLHGDPRIRLLRPQG